MPCQAVWLVAEKKKRENLTAKSGRLTDDAAWQRLSVESSAPKTARWARIILHSEASQAAVWFDDAEIVRVP